jgi:16S rRNA (guanine966-N2)-methyltransferase
MRVIGGQFRSRLISMPKGVEMRPTQDKVRQAVFNILADVSGRKVLDLFAGSGAFGIESISRGASHATFVDNNFKCIDTIEANLKSLGIPASCYGIIRSDADKAIRSLAEGRDKFDIIFMDPPYYRDMAKKSLISIDEYDILSHIGLVVVEHFKKDILASDLKGLVLDKERRYGDTTIAIYRKTDYV